MAISAQITNQFGAILGQSVLKNKTTLKVQSGERYHFMDENGLLPHGLKITQVGKDAVVEWLDPAAPNGKSVLTLENFATTPDVAISAPSLGASNVQGLSYAADSGLVTYSPAISAPAYAAPASGSDGLVTAAWLIGGGLAAAAVGSGGSGGGTTPTPPTDTTPPAAPTIHAIAASNQNPSTLSGTAEAGSTVQVTTGGAVYTVTATANGAWTLNTASTPHTGTFAPTANVATPVLVVSTDAAGNHSANSSIFTVDTIAPTVQITDGIAGTANIASGTITYTFTLSEASSDFSELDISISGGSLVAGSFIQIDATHYTVTATPTLGNNAANMVVSVNAGVLHDAAGNGNTAASNTQAYDTVVPTVQSVTLGSTSLLGGQTTSVTIVFSEAITQFNSATDVTVENGVLSSMTSNDGITWVGTFTASANVNDASNVISVVNASYTDLANNAGTGLQSGNYSISREVHTILGGDAVGSPAGSNDASDSNTVIWGVPLSSSGGGPAIGIGATAMTTGGNRLWLGDDLVQSGGGKDFIQIFAADAGGNDTIDGGADENTLVYTGFSSSITVDLGTGTANLGAFGTQSISNIYAVYLGDGNDAFQAAASGSAVYDRSGSDTLLGGAGADLIADLDYEADVINGAGGVEDLLAYSSEFTDRNRGISVTLDASGTTIDSDFNTISGIEHLDLSRADDFARGSSANNQIYARDGNDTLYGMAGNDSLFGGMGNDLIEGGIGQDNVSGDEGNDTVIDGDQVADVMDGGDGIDVIDFSVNQVTPGLVFVPMAITVNLQTGVTSHGDALSGFENVVGTALADSIIGNEGTGTTQDNNVLDGGAGDDFLSGLGGDDTLFGGDGDDTLLGGEGINRLDGGADIDWADYSNSANAVSVSLGNNNQVNAVFSSTGDMLLNIENLQGSNLADTLTGDANANTINGGAGADLTSGGAGDDYLIDRLGANTVYGNAGNDTLLAGNNSSAQYFDGGANDDVLTGGAAGDTLLGGDGADFISGEGGADSTSGGLGADEIYGGDGADTVFSSAGNLSLGTDAGNSYVGGDDASIDVLDLSARTDDLIFTVTAVGNTSNVGDHHGQIQSGPIPAGGGLFVTPSEDAYEGFERIFMGAGNDAFTTDDGNGSGGNPAVWVNGGAGNDTITGGTASDTLFGGDGNDLIATGEGYANLVDGGNGYDTFNSNFAVLPAMAFPHSLNAVNATTLVHTDGVGGQAATTLVNVELFNLTGGADVVNLTGYTQDITINLGAGSGYDDVVSGSGNDSLYGMINATAHGGGGNDTLRFAEGGTYYGDDGNDYFVDESTVSSLSTQINDAFGGAGNDTFVGGVFSNITVRYNDVTTGGVTVQLGAGNAGAGGAYGGAQVGADTFYNVQSVVLTYQNDSAVGNELDNVFNGGNGSDTLLGMGGNDALTGGFASSTGGNYIDGGDGNDRLTGGQRADTLLGGNGNDTIMGLDGNDLINGGAGSDSIQGGIGNDSIYVQAQSGDRDTVYAGADDDIIDYTQAASGALGQSLYGEAGSDVIRVSARAQLSDRYDGGTGVDVLQFTGSYVGGPSIDLSALTNAAAASGVIKGTEVLDFSNAVGATLTLNAASILNASSTDDILVITDNAGGGVPANTVYVSTTGLVGAGWGLYSGGSFNFSDGSQVVSAGGGTYAIANGGAATSNWTTATAYSQGAGSNYVVYSNGANTQFLLVDTDITTSAHFTFG